MLAVVIRTTLTVLLACAAGADTIGEDPRVAAMRGEGLLETTPESLGTTNRVLSRAFERGVRDLDAYTYLLKIVVQHALDLAERQPEQAAAYRRAAVAMTYNLAANTWPGWGELGDVDPAHLRLGLQAARTNVELAREVGLGPERRKNGYWILGAQLVAHGRYDEAVRAFAESRDLAAEAGDEASRLMAQGWIHAAEVLAGRDADAALEAIRARLIALGGDGPFLAAQYAPALAVFGG